MALTPTRLLAALACALALAGTSAAAADIRIAFTLSPDSYQGRGVARFAQLVHERSQGRLTVIPVSGSAAGTEAKFIQDTVDGRVEMSVPTTTGLVPITPAMALWDTPLFFSTAREADTVLDGAVGRRTLDALAATGLVGLAFWENGFREVTNDVHPVLAVGDFKGLRLRVIPTRIAMATFEQLGAHPLPMPFNDVPAALARHSIDGQENPLGVIQSAKLYTVQRYLSLTNHLYSPFAVVASGRWWRRLPAADRAIVSGAAFDARLFEREQSRTAAQVALAALKDEGMEINAIDLTNRSLMSYRLERCIHGIVDAVGIDLWIQANAELAQARDDGRR